MKLLSKRTLLLLPVCLLAAHAVASGAPTHPHQSTGSLTANFLRTAARWEAHGEFFTNLAKCLHDPGTPFFWCVAEAHDELDEALDLADEQREARLEVLDWVGDGAYDPDLDPDDFTAAVTAPYLPLVVGRTLAYEKLTDEGLERIEVTTLDETFEVDGIECRVVRDVVTLDGEFVEDTDDWFAQSTYGDVWYLGEIARDYEDGILTDLDGSWRTGVDGAKAGIQMLACPSAGDAYRQEYLVGEAEDVARVIRTDATVVVPAGTFFGCLETEDWTPIEPGVFERKFYAPGVGLVLEVNVGSGARTELVEIQG